MATIRCVLAAAAFDRIGRRLEADDCAAPFLAIHLASTKVTVAAGNLAVHFQFAERFGLLAKGRRGALPVGIVVVPCSVAARQRPVFRRLRSGGGQRWAGVDQQGGYQRHVRGNVKVHLGLSWVCGGG